MEQQLSTGKTWKTSAEQSKECHECFRLFTQTELHCFRWFQRCPQTPDAGTPRCSIVVCCWLVGWLRGWRAVQRMDENRVLAAANAQHARVFSAATETNESE